MIRERALVKNGSISSVRIRVVACRKRMRVFRAIHKAQFELQMVDQGTTRTEHTVASVETTTVFVEESPLVLPLSEESDAQLT